MSCGTSRQAQENWICCWWKTKQDIIPACDQRETLLSGALSDLCATYARILRPKAALKQPICHKIGRQRGLLNARGGYSASSIRPLVFSLTHCRVEVAGSRDDTSCQHPNQTCKAIVKAHQAVGERWAQRRLCCNQIAVAYCAII